jgi:predicted neutral ceramidase superfamily lipid hydrolase
LNDLDGVDRRKVSTLAESVRRAHAEGEFPASVREG